MIPNEMWPTAVLSEIKALKHSKEGSADAILGVRALPSVKRFETRIEK